jgi:hypothetical protein
MFHLRVEGAPNIVGAYVLNGYDNVVFQLAQDALGDISATYQFGVWRLDGNGTWNGSFFEYVATVSHLLLGNTMSMTGKLIVSSPGSLTLDLAMSNRIPPDCGPWVSTLQHIWLKR